MGPVLAFWAVALLVAALALPLAFTLLRRLPDCGAGMSFALGLALLGWAYFSLRVASILPPGRGGYLAALALFALASAAVAGRDRRFARTLRMSSPSLMAMGGLFTLAFFAFVAFRSYVPQIDGTEQPMDFMYLNATVASEQYPPRDPWLAGEPASYYYFGYLQVGALTEIAGVQPSLGYNLGLAYTFAAAATGMASLTFALARWAMGGRARGWAIGAAAGALVLLLFVGSLSAIFEWAAAHGNTNRGLYEAFGVEWMVPCAPPAPGAPAPATGAAADCFSGPNNPRTTAWYPTEFWFWWRGSRIIPETITEFPFFSFLLGDLHPQLMSIPLVLLVLGLAASWFRGRGALSWETHRRNPWRGLAIGLILGALAFENAWDMLTFSAIFAVAVVARNLRALPTWDPPAKTEGVGFLSRLGAALPAPRATVAYLAPIAAIAVLAYLPWYLDFSSQASGFYAYVGRGTRPQHAFLQFGPLLGAALVALAWAVRRGELRIAGDGLFLTAAVPVVPFIVWLALAALRGDLDTGLAARTGGGWLTLASYALAAWALAAAFLVHAYQRRGSAPLLGLLATGTLLLYGAELFYIKDIFAGVSPRLNTVFKLTYQAWILLSAGGAVALAVALRRAIRGRQWAGYAAVPVVVLAAGGLIYPLTATPNRTGNFNSQFATIDGLDFLARFDPPEYALTQWIRTQTDPSAVFIEASGREWRYDSEGVPRITNASVDYTASGRIAVRTGRQTPIGWYFHELQWRGDDRANQQRFVGRQDAVDAVYLAKDPAAAIAGMRAFGARYLVVGRVEMNRYPADAMPPFAQFLDIAFEAGGLRVYELPRYLVVPTS